LKTLALALILVLHATGLWPHISAANRAQIASRASAVAPQSDPAILPSPAPSFVLPVRLSTTPLTLDAASAIAIDRSTATILYAKNVGDHRPIASVTKLITALVILSRHSPDERITIPTLPTYPQEAETIGLVPGDTFKLSDVLEAALVPSANDAADALAISDAGSVKAFAERMNAKMAQWGIADTHFTGASGLEDAGNYTSAAALAKIASLALASPTLAGIVKYSAISITSDQGHAYNLKSTNDLLASGQFYGIKTGYTLLAGECFVGLTRVNGHEVITVVLGSTNRFGTTTTLTNWIGRTWQWL
jgi:D-alanyl-D-alanine carboxypeptidase (penicillin-binding protein 5/6)